MSNRVNKHQKIISSPEFQSFLLMKIKKNYCINVLRNLKYQPTNDVWNCARSLCLSLSLLSWESSSGVSGQSVPRAGHVKSNIWVRGGGSPPLPRGLCWSGCKLCCHRSFCEEKKTNFLQVIIMSAWIPQHFCSGLWCPSVSMIWSTSRPPWSCSPCPSSTLTSSSTWPSPPPSLTSCLQLR